MTRPAKRPVVSLMVKRPTVIERARDFYLELIRTVPPVGAKCDDCGELFPLANLEPLLGCSDLDERLSAGSIVPDGECPTCGAFCYRF